MEIYIVGGAIRDVVLGNHPKDMDYVVVGSSPKEMIKLGFKPIEAASFPVFHDDGGNEYALARKERKVGVGYHGFECDYDSTITLEEDLYRRDLTINAMAVHKGDWGKFLARKDKHFIEDPYNGLQDLSEGLVRHVSDHFAEDPVRALRAIRFAIKYDFTISGGTKFLIRDMVSKGELDHLTPERIWLEVEKVLSDKYQTVQYLGMCDNFGMLEKMFPNYDNLHIDHETMVKYENSNINDLRFAFLAMLGGNNLSFMEHFGKTMKISNEYMKLFYILNMSKHLGHLGNSDASTSILGYLKASNVYQNGISPLLDVLKYLREVDGDLDSECDIIELLATSTSTIRYDHLSLSDRKTLKGKEIGKAIDNVRLKVINEKLNEIYGG